MHSAFWHTVWHSCNWWKSADLVATKYKIQLSNSVWVSGMSDSKRKHFRTISTYLVRITTPKYTIFQNEIFSFTYLLWTNWNNHLRNYIYFKIQTQEALFSHIYWEVTAIPKTKTEVKIRGEINSENVCYYLFKNPSWLFCLLSKHFSS